MYVKELTLKNFRNYKYLNIEFSPDINFFVGYNGVGKTNIIEAIYITSNMKSFRNIHDSEIIKWDENSYYCSSVVGECSYQKFEIGCSNISNRLRKKAKIDGNEVRKASEYFGKLLTVIFAPTDINIINSGPELRRKFFDSALSKVDSDYFNTLNEFKKVLSSRNKLLKKSNENNKQDFKQLEIWDRMFAEKASIILKKRLEFLEIFDTIFRSSYSSISEGSNVPAILYSSSTGSIDENEIFDVLLKRRKKDFIIGSTGIGPQRDDYILCNDKKNKFINYASQGQRRTAAISLKISEYEIIKEKTGEKSVIMIDDIFSELDKKRRENMINILKSRNQVIFTVVNSDSVSMNSYGNYKSFIVEPEGKVNEI